jgi:hypothetical protein
MMMHDVKMTRKIKRTNNSNIGFSWVVAVDTTNKGSCPEIHVKAGEELVRLLNLLAPC